MMGGCKKHGNKAYYTGNIPKRRRFKKKKTLHRPPISEPRKNSSRIKICIVKDPSIPAFRRKSQGLRPVQSYKSMDGKTDRDVYYLSDDMDPDEFRCYDQTDDEDPNTSGDNSCSENNETSDSEYYKNDNQQQDDSQKQDENHQKPRCYIREGKDWCYAHARGDLDEIPIGKFDPVTKGVYGTECELPCVNQGGICKSFPMYCCKEAYEEIKSPEKTCDDLISGLYCRSSFEYYEDRLREIIEANAKKAERTDCCACFGYDTYDRMGRDIKRDVNDMSGCKCGDVCPAVEAYMERRDEEVYKFVTTLEKWKPGKMKICCPVCSVIDSPAIKQTKRRALIANTGFQASILVAFWPLCMLPFMMAQSRILLFCKNCKNYLGQYDKRKGCVKPPEPLKEQIAKILYKDYEEVFD
ncbi:unnamed protein product [Brassicogethes aeneus]|uniref:LITAF domain-containing protein n=1 Tax=Brassicogethes aeneus TaxID=1431903 RepID=A0A9P0F8A1_BRAAE|nr:unnamed protein product [Brassicogethes aeneus]